MKSNKKMKKRPFSALSLSLQLFLLSVLISAVGQVQRRRGGSMHAACCAYIKNFIGDKSITIYSLLLACDQATATTALCIRVA